MSHYEGDWPDLKKILAPIVGVYEKPPENIVVNRYADGAMLGNGDAGVMVGGSYNELVLRIGKNDFWTDDAPINTESSFKGVRPITVGGITLKFKGTGSPSGYRMEQDILNAEVRSTLTVDECTVRMKSWLAAAENILITDITIDGDKPLSVAVSTWVPALDAFPIHKRWQRLHLISGYYASDTGAEKDIIWSTRETYRGAGVRWVSRAAIAARLPAPAAEITTDQEFETTAYFSLEPAKTVTLVSAIQGGRDVTDHLSGALSRLAACDKDEIAKVHDAHLEWWKRYWLKSYVRLNDELLERYYYGALYNIACCSREGKNAPGLLGNWITTDNPFCHSDYHLNYNFQAPYYGVYSANRTELAAPYYEAVLSYLPEARRRASDDISSATKLPFPNGIRGALYPVGIGPWASTPDGNYHNQVSNGTFAAIPLIWHYEFTQDIDFLRDKLYPLLLELADFWEDYLQEDETGRYVVYAASYEGYQDVNPAQDLGFVRLLFTTLLSAAAELGRNADRWPRWREILEKLSDYPLFTFQGKSVYNRSESAEDLMVGNTTDNLEFIHPAGCLGLTSEKERLQIARDTIRIMDAWTQGNNVPKIFPQAVQVGYPIEETIARFKALMKTTFRNNLTLYQNGGGIETDGAVEAINLMLLQSNEGFLNLFPVWLTDRDASFKRLRARGAFLVSSEFRNGAVQGVEIFSEKGKVCRIRCPWKGKQARVLKISPAGGTEILYKTDGDILEFPTESGGIYRLQE